ncbi:hypothetical protein GIB67_020366 [Kingdonia uniflora]|uniref:Gag-pol polyprotein n=1 Tax=Kingdonia uniflora TaxID=39325 RepID=A0A7J7LR97_9MAGN|nr:hypothetical protein GIB67_020366 [Kingdonia uniflora]
MVAFFQSIGEDVWIAIEDGWSYSTEMRGTPGDAIEMLTSQFENIRMDKSEPLDEIYARLSDIINTRVALGAAYSDVQIVHKVLRSLPKGFRFKRDAIEEAQDLKKMKLDTLAGKLQTFELEMRMENPEKNKSVAFKSSSSSKGTIEADNSSSSDNDDGSDMDSQIASINHQLKNYVQKCEFQKQEQSVNRKSRTHDQLKLTNWQTNLDTNQSQIECYKYHKLGHYAHRCPNRKSGTNHKAMSINATWDDSDNEHDNNESHTQVVDNGNYIAYLAFLNCGNNNFDVFELENSDENQSNQEHDEFDDPNLEDLYAQTLAKYMKLCKRNKVLKDRGT